MGEDGYNFAIGALRSDKIENEKPIRVKKYQRIAKETVECKSS